MSWSVTKSRIECSVWDTKNKVKNKVKDAVDYTKNNPGKIAAKVATNVAVNTVLPGGKVTTTVARATVKNGAATNKLQSFNLNVIFPPGFSISVSIVSVSWVNSISEISYSLLSLPITISPGL